MSSEGAVALYMLKYASLLSMEWGFFCKLLPLKFPDKVKKVLNKRKKRAANNDLVNVRIHSSSS